MEINIFELDNLFQRMHAYLTLACDGELGKREREDNTQKFKQTQKEIATWVLNKMGNQSQPRMANNNVIKIKGGRVLCLEATK
jgi:hypothetical protein